MNSYNYLLNLYMKLILKDAFSITLREENKNAAYFNINGFLEEK